MGLQFDRVHQLDSIELILICLLEHAGKGIVWDLALKTTLVKDLPNGPCANEVLLRGYEGV